jgi:histidyl-tRNA synthetase
MASVHKPRGTRDFPPEEMEKRRVIEKKMRDVFKKYSYEEVSTPTFEHVDLFTLKSGEGIIEETYDFTDKSGRRLALRPEITAPVMRFYVEKLQMKPKPLKVFYFGNCFRYDRPQSGRYREFWQMGCEMIGSDTPEAIAELIALAYKVVKRAGLKNINLRIGHLDYLSQQMEKTLPSNISLSNFYPAGAAAWKNNMFRLMDKGDYEELRAQFETVNAPLKKINEFMNFLKSGSIDDLRGFIKEEKLKPYEEILSLLKKFGVPKVEVGMEIARGLDYYQDIVFEIDAPVLGAEKQICGGGAYKLVSLLGGKEVPTSGFALGFDRIILALEKEGFKFPPSEKPVYLLPIGDEMRENAVSLATELRKSGVKVEMDLMRRSVRKLLQYANKKGIKKVIILGSDEWKKWKKDKVVVIKDMEKGEQKEIKKKELLNNNIICK